MSIEPPLLVNFRAFDWRFRRTYWNRWESVQTTKSFKLSKPSNEEAMLTPQNSAFYWRTSIISWTASLMLKLNEFLRNFPALSRPKSRVSFTRNCKILVLELYMLIDSFSSLWNFSILFFILETVSVSISAFIISRNFALTCYCLTFWLKMALIGFLMSWLTVALINDSNFFSPLAISYMISLLISTILSTCRLVSSSWY